MLISRIGAFSIAKTNFGMQRTNIAKMQAFTASYSDEAKKLANESKEKYLKARIADIDDKLSNAESFVQTYDGNQDLSKSVRDSKREIAILTGKKAELEKKLEDLS